MTAPLADDHVLLISCLGEDTGGGLFAFDGERVELVDRLTCTGLAVTENRLLRVLPSGAESAVSELLIYDNVGVRQYCRLDGVSDPHDLLWDGESIAIVSTATNSVIWISPAGEVIRECRLPGDGDSWHVNSLWKDATGCYLSAFGRFERHRQWTQHKIDGAGLVIDMASGETVLSGLDQPHHPRHVDGSWIICNSARGELLQVDGSTGTIQRRRTLAGYTRGLAITDEAIFVGQSAKRSLREQLATASIAILDRQRWEVCAEIQVPCREVYDVVIAPASLLNGPRQGFRTNPRRQAEDAQHALFRAAGVEPVRLWATGDPLPAQACRARVEATVPRRLPMDEVANIEAVVENLGRAIFVSAPPFPVVLSYRWLTASGSEVENAAGVRTSLPRSLTPGDRVKCRMAVQTPRERGHFTLVITLLQEQVAWFDLLCESNASRHSVCIFAPGAEVSAE